MSLVWHPLSVWADPVCFSTFICSHFSTPTSVQLSWPWVFLPPGLCKDSFLSGMSSPGTLTHYPLGILSGTSFLCPPALLLFSFVLQWGSLPSAPVLWCLVVCLPKWDCVLLGGRHGALLVFIFLVLTHSWPQCELNKWMDDKWMNLPAWIVNVLYRQISHSQYFAKPQVFLKIEM